MGYIYCKTDAGPKILGSIDCSLTLSNTTNSSGVCSYPPSSNSSIPVTIDTLVKASGVVGTFIGQVTFGVLGDILGRTRMYGIVLVIMVTSTVGSALSASTVSGVNVFVVLGIWRLFVGVGIGGDFPLSGGENFIKYTNILYLCYLNKFKCSYKMSLSDFDSRVCEQKMERRNDSSSISN